MKDESKNLHEAIAMRYLNLAGIGEDPVIGKDQEPTIKEEEEEFDPEETVEDAFAGGDNLVNPVDHVAAVSDLTEEKISDIVSKVKALIKENQKLD